MNLAATALLLALLWQVPGRVAPEPQHFRLQRGVRLDPGPAQRACAVLDGDVYAHALAGLADVRLFAAGNEVPYATTMSQTAAGGDAAEVFNQGQRAGKLTFDLRMPDRPYSDVTLALGAADFVATAKVSGLRQLDDARATELGSFTLFDLSGQRLGRSTTLRLGESTFPFLHVELSLAGANGAPKAVTAATVTGAEVPPSREAQTLYSVVAESTSITQRGQQSLAVFEIPARLPVERVTFVLDAGDRTNFSRSVRIIATAGTDPRATGQRPASEVIAGQISRVRITQSGRTIHEESRAVSAILGSNGQTSAKVEVAVDNADDRPLAIHAVRLEMRERKLCFDVPAAPVTMLYGDPRLVAPLYDYSRLFSPLEPARAAHIEPETANPTYAPRVETTPFMERHPEILWLALFAVISVLGIVAFRSAKRV